MKCGLGKLIQLRSRAFPVLSVPVGKRTHWREKKQPKSSHSCLPVRLRYFLFVFLKIKKPKQRASSASTSRSFLILAPRLSFCPFLLPFLLLPFPPIWKLHYLHPLSRPLPTVVYLSLSWSVSDSVSLSSRRNLSYFYIRQQPLMPQKCSTNVNRSTGTLTACKPKTNIHAYSEPYSHKSIH